MDQAITITMADATTSYVQAFVSALNQRVEQSSNLDPKKIDFVSILDDLEVLPEGDKPY